VDLSGQVFDRLTVLPLYEVINHRVYWVCICKCGNEHLVSGKQLRQGKTTSCGCKKIERCVLMGRAKRKYIGVERPHCIWRGMLTRCTRKKDAGYENYGGRGISVCDKWKTFEGFWEDMKDNYKNGLTLDRIDNDGNYTKDNCRWATHYEQAQNTRTNRNITYKGEEKCLTEWARNLGIDRSTLSLRLKRMSVEQALETPLYSRTLKC
jgi:hypothetical protein